MAVAGPLSLILGIGAVLGAATSQAIPVRLEQGGDRLWGEVSPERYPEIVAVTYDTSPGTYYAPHAYTAVAPVIPAGQWDVLPVDDYPPTSVQGQPIEYPGREAVSTPGDNQQQVLPEIAAEEAYDDGGGDQYAPDHEAENDIVPITAPAGA